jgi:hypothetical protein
MEIRRTTYCLIRFGSNLFAIHNLTMAVIIRKWTTEDRETLALHANNIQICNRLRNYFPHPYTLDHADGWIER